MKTSGVIICLLLAALTLSCESAHQQLDSLDDLRTIDFGESVPIHSLLLLYWFAHTVNIEPYYMVTVNFNPNRDFGSHPYGNYENLLDQPRYGYQYYTVGNLYESSSYELPDYIRNPPVRDNSRRNRGRIIFSAERQNSRPIMIDRIYLTQHDLSSNEYDPNHTYQISINLLRQIRQYGNPTALLRAIFEDNRLRSWSTGRYTYPSYYEQSSSSNRGTGGEIWECVCRALMLLTLLFIFAVLIFHFAQRK